MPKELKALIEDIEKKIKDIFGAEYTIGAQGLRGQPVPVESREYSEIEKELKKEQNKIDRYIKKNDEYEVRKVNYERNKEYFGPVCEALGKALALRHHTIVLSVPYWDMISRCNTVANYVAFGASKVERENKKPNKLILHIPQEVVPKDIVVNDTDKFGEKPKSLQGFRNLPHIALEEKFIPGKGEFKSKTIPNITDVDAVILVGGHDGTMNVGYAAYSLSKPCITVASVGGAAQQLFDDLFSFEYQRFVRQGIIKEQDIIALTASVQENDLSEEKSAYDIVRTTEKITSAYGIVNERTRQVLWTILIGSLGLLAAWVHLFTYIGTDLKLPLQYSLSPHLLAGIVLMLDIWIGYVNFRQIVMMTDTVKKSSVIGVLILIAIGSLALLLPVFQKQIIPPVTVNLFASNLLFLFLFITALIGTGLRFLCAYLDNQIPRLTFIGLATESMVSVIVAFSLLLLLFVGELFLDGNAKWFADGDKNSSVTGAIATVDSVEKAKPENDSQPRIAVAQTVPQQNDKNTTSPAATDSSVENDISGIVRPDRADTAETAQKPDAVTTQVGGQAIRVPVKSEDLQMIDFIRISIIGFAAGYLTLIDKLNKRMQKLFSDE